MRKLTVILMISFLSVGMTSCRRAGRELVEEFEHEAVQPGATRIIFQELEQDAAQPAEREAIRQVGRQGVQQASFINQNRLLTYSLARENLYRDEIYDTAYKAAQQYLNSRVRQASFDKANEIAANVAYKKSRQQGEVLTDAMVMITASAAASAAYATYNVLSGEHEDIPQVEPKATQQGFINQNESEVVTYPLTTEDRYTKEIYDAAYKAAQQYLNSRARRASFDKANEIAAKAASKKNRQQGEVLTEAMVMITAGAASSSAYINYGNLK